MTSSRRSRALLPAFALFAVAALASMPAHAAIPFKDISSSGPLTHVYVGNTLSCQAAHSGDNALEFYSPNTIPGDCGTFVATSGTLYAPDFWAQGTTATGNLGGRTVFTPVSQSGVTGSGTPSDPFKVITVAGVGTTGLRLSEIDSYITGRDSYRTDVTVTNTGAASVTFTLFRAGDCYLGGSDVGYGFATSSGAVACTKNANNTPADRVEQWVPISADSHYFEEFYGSVWTRIGQKQPFDNTCRCTDYIDNGGGLSWTTSLTAGASKTFSHITNFGVAAVETKLTANPATVDVSATPGAYLKLSARLAKKDGDTPIAGRPIDFSIGSTLVCTAVTDSSGNAGCGGVADLVNVLQNGSYSALFGGDSDFLAAVANGPFLRVLGNNIP